MAITAPMKIMAPFLPVLMSASNLFSEYIGLIVRIYFSMAILIISAAPYTAQFGEKTIKCLLASLLSDALGVTAV